MPSLARLLLPFPISLASLLPYQSRLPISSLSQSGLPYIQIHIYNIQLSNNMHILFTSPHSLPSLARLSPLSPNIARLSPPYEL